MPKLEQSEKTQKGVGAERRSNANSQCDGWPCRDCRGCSRPILAWDLRTYYRTNQSVLLNRFLYRLFCAPVFEDQLNAINRNSGARRVYDASNHRASATACLSSWPWPPTKRPEQHNNKDHGDYGEGDGNRHNGLLAHNLASQYCGRFSNSGSLAMLMAMRRASSRVIRCAARERERARRLFVISASESVPVVVLHNEARAVVIDHPMWREPADGHRLRTDLEQIMNKAYNEFPNCNGRPAVIDSIKHRCKCYLHSLEANKWVCGGGRWDLSFWPR